MVDPREVSLEDRATSLLVNSVYDASAAVNPMFSLSPAAALGDFDDEEPEEMESKTELTHTPRLGRAVRDAEGGYIAVSPDES